MSTNAGKKMNTSLLYNDHSIPVSPKLATAIGLNEAIILQQLHYWTMPDSITGKVRNVRDGFSWVYNSVAKWSAQFPWWSESTIRRTLASLESQGLVITGCYNRDKRDRTKWYRVNHEAVAAISHRVLSRTVQNEQMQDAKVDECVGSDCTNAPSQNDQTITIDYPETTPETNNTPTSGEPDPVRQVFDYWVEVMGKTRATVLGSKRKAKIEKALKAYGLDNVKKAIEGCRNTPYNMGDNERGQRYDDIELILRDETKIERFMANADNPPAPARAARPMHNLNSLDHEGDPMMAGDGRIAPEPRRTRG